MLRCPSRRGGVRRGESSAAWELEWTGHRGTVEDLVSSPAVKDEFAMMTEESSMQELYFFNNPQLWLPGAFIDEAPEFPSNTIGKT
jgi:hypothetical protein